MAYTISGNANLPDQQNTINFVQNNESSELSSYTRGFPPAPAPPSPGGSPPHNNLAAFETIDLAENPRLVSLIELTAGQTVNGILSQHTGKTLIFVSDIWVSGVIKKIVGIR